MNCFKSLLLVGLPLPLLAQHTIFVPEEELEFVPPGEPYFIGWDDALWDPEFPNSNSDIYLSSVFDEFGDETELWVDLQSSVTVRNLELDFGSDLTTYDNTLTVTGETSGYGFLTVSNNGKASLGTLNGFTAATGNLSSQSPAYLVDSSRDSGPAILEFRGADIRINGAGFNLFGPNSIVRDQNTGLDAFRNLERNESFFSLDDGFALSTPGNFTNAGNASITLALNASDLPPSLTVAGNFINDGVVRMRGNTVLSIGGGYSGTGTIELSGSNNQISAAGAFALGSVTRVVEADGSVIFDSDVSNSGDLNAEGNGGLYDVSGTYTQNGGNVNTGVSETDSFILRAEAQFYDGGASVTGNGRLETTGGITAANGRIFPGLSPGKLTLTGNFDFQAPSLLGIEIGGITPGTEYDVLAQSAGDTGITLGGSLDLTIIDDFECDLTESQSFTIVTSDLPIQGSFSNVSSGARLATTDGLGTFLVTYGPGAPSPNTVVLSDFEAAPVAPITFADWATAAELPAGQDGPFDDANSNGIPNVIEYYGGSPKGLPMNFTLNEPEGTVTVSASFAKYANDQFTLILEQSSDLSSGSWLEAENFNQAGTTAAKNLRELTLPIEIDRVFFRFRVIEEVP